MVVSPVVFTLKPLSAFIREVKRCIEGLEKNGEERVRDVRKIHKETP